MPQLIGDATGAELPATCVTRPANSLRVPRSRRPIEFQAAYKRAACRRPITRHRHLAARASIFCQPVESISRGAARQVRPEDAARQSRRPAVRDGRGGAIRRLAARRLPAPATSVAQPTLAGHYANWPPLPLLVYSRRRDAEGELPLAPIGVAASSGGAGDCEGPSGGQMAPHRSEAGGGRRC